MRSREIDVVAVKRAGREGSVFRDDSALGIHKSRTINKIAMI